MIECDPLELKDGKRVSSTLVRELLAEGRVDEAADCLGHRYSVEGKVVGGYREGRKIGFRYEDYLDDGEYYEEDGEYYEETSTEE